MEAWEEFSLRWKGPKCSWARGSEGDVSLALFLLDDAAIHSRDINALEMAIHAILRNRGEEQAINRAISLLERFYACANVNAESTGRGRHNLSMFLGNEEHVKTVMSLFEDILYASKHSVYAALRYGMYLFVLVCHRGLGTREDAALPR